MGKTLLPPNPKLYNPSSIVHRPTTRVALDAVPEELRHDHENHPALANLYEGIHMTNAGLDKAFAKHGLKKFGDVGDVFGV